MTTFFLINCLTYTLHKSFIIGKKCDDECYLNVQKKLKNVTDSFALPSNVSNIFDEYSTVKNFTSTVEGITDDLNKIQDLMQKNLEQVKNQTRQHEKTLNNCEQAKDLYKNLT